MRFSKILLALMIAALLIPLAGVHGALAGSSGDRFGFGARMDASLAYSGASSHTANSLALAVAAQSHLNWIALNLDWAAIAPQASEAPDLSGLVVMINEVEQQGMEILLSIQNPPEWALTANGPAPELVQAFLSQVSRITANRIQVIELFPGANLADAWGAPANPAGYLSVLLAARAALRTNQQISLVIPSLTPLFQPAGPGDLSAESFLAELYQLAPNENFQILGLHFSRVIGNPADYGAAGAGAYLRQYEVIRQVMLDHGRSSDQMWITAFAWPETLTNETDQAAWVESAYRQLQGQIYIKAAFFNALYLGNAPGMDSTAGPAALLEPTLKAHTALTRIRTIATQTGEPAGTLPANDTNLQEHDSGLAKLWKQILSFFGW